jgi:Sulfotransferase domain
VHFFSKNFQKGISWYREHFPTHLYMYSVGKLLGRDLVTGEASTDYVLHPKAAERVFNALPQVKLIVILRNPIDRAYSHYNHEVVMGRESLPFEAAIELEPERLKGEKGKVFADDDFYNTYNYQRYSYLTRGIYIDQLKRWMTLFPRDQFCVLRSEDFYADPGAALSRTLEYLGLERFDLKEYEKYNYAGYTRLEAIKHNYTAYPTLSATLRRNLINYFKPYNERLYELLGRDFDWDSE